MVELLVARGCALDSTDQEGRTALRAASWSGHEDIVRILVTHGAQINLTDHEGKVKQFPALNQKLKYQIFDFRSNCPDCSRVYGSR